MPSTIVIGLGNLLLSDEGVGVHVIEALREHASRYPDVEFIDLGAGGLSLLHYLAGLRTAILIDCAFMEAPAGTLRRFTPEEVTSVKTLAGFSLHEGDLLQVLSLARKLDMAPEEIIIFGIQPAEVGPGDRLSPALQGRLPEYVNCILQELDARTAAPEAPA